MNDFHEQTVALSGGPIRVQTRGAGPALIWTHGVFHPIDVDDHSPLGSVMRRVEGHRIVRYDTRGHGRTPPAATDAAHRWDRLGAELIELADALGIDRFVAGGISMGAAVSLHAAARAPDRVAGLVLLAPPTGWETRPPEKENYRALAALESPVRVAARVEQDLERAFAPHGVPGPLQIMVDGLRRHDGVALGRVLRAAAESDLPARESLAKLALPALVLPWENDPGHPLETARAIAATLPNAALQVIRGFDDADGVLAAIQGFLRERARTAQT